MNALTLYQSTLRTNSPMDWKPQVFGIDKYALHSIIVLKVGMALRAFSLADLGFKDTRTEWAFDVSFGFGSGGHSELSASQSMAS